MKAVDIAEAVLANIASNPNRDMAVALQHGMQDLYIAQPTGSMDFRFGVDTRKINKLRQLFTLWKAVVKIVVQDKRWPLHPEGFRDRATSEGIEAFALFFFRLNPKAFLEMFDNNVFLGWTPSELARNDINKLRWSFKNMSHYNRGLSFEHLRQADADHRRHAR